MQKRRGNFLKSAVACNEIMLLVLVTFAVAFFISQTGTVSAQSLPAGTQEYRAEGRGPLLNFDDAPAAGGAKGIGDFVGDIYKGKLFEGFAGHLVGALAWAGTAAVIAQVIGGFLGLEDGEQKALTTAAALGAFAGSFAAYQAGSNGFQMGILNGLGQVQGGILIGGVVTVVVFALLYSKESKKTVRFECLPWEAPLGGAKCEECNGDPLHPCSEYRCKALGQACDLVNKGTSEERCVWVSRDDVNAPTITPWDEPLTEGYSYSNHDTLPRSLGVKIVRGTNGCVEPFTALEFGIVTNEPAQCKISTEHSDKMDDMAFYFGESNFFSYNHTQKLSLPSPDSINSESPEMQNDGIYNFYVRCRDANGNENTQEYDFNLCVDPSPDTTAPLIVDTSITSGSPVTFGADSVNLSVYTNEPAQCRWSIDDKDYDEMETAMSCSTHIYEQNAQQLYPCATTLTGIKDRQENKFYFRCKDQPLKEDSERNENTQSYPFTLRGTEALHIVDVGPNETVYGSTQAVTVYLSAETGAGENEGNATCSFSATGNEGTFVEMFDTRSYKHNQSLSLGAGDYTYHFRCVDAGGNSDTAQTSFSVFVDTEEPMITRAYREDGLKVVTNEDAECVYSLNSCTYNFADGLKMIYSNPSIKTNHFAKWTPNIVYYIKCRDFYGNQPNPDECSLVASASTVR